MDFPNREYQLEMFPGVKSHIYCNRVQVDGKPSWQYTPMCSVEHPDRIKHYRADETYETFAQAVGAARKGEVDWVWFFDVMKVEDQP